ncbi:hypothetical protein K488DRAFT_25873, partial [Vararia minispora EC-137]
SSASPLGVANSAGPDSTCLLFLLSRLFSICKDPAFPRCIHSFHINHGFQEASGRMAEVAHANAVKFHAESHVLPIPWGEGMYPLKPKAGEPIELIARQARQRRMFDGMRDADVDIVAFGHHADDQVETSVMRWSKGSSPFGLAGMAHIRRWGMGDGHDLQFFGTEGLSKWVIRPLLPIAKERILATCDFHNLEYVVDETNFQPDLTLRNSIRTAIADLRSSNALSENMFLQKLKEANIISKTVSSIPYDFIGDSLDLYGSVQLISTRMEEIEAEAIMHLDLNRVQSPPGTFLLATGGRLLNATHPLIQSAMILCILRYVSPMPWGSVQAQGHRRGQNIRSLVSRVFTPWDQLEPQQQVPVSAGGQVIWRPMRIKQDGYLRHFRDTKYPEPRPLSSGERLGWLACRVPPQTHEAEKLTIDATDMLRAADERVRRHGSGLSSAVEFLWDCRFLIRFRLDCAPTDVREKL